MKNAIQLSNVIRRFRNPSRYPTWRGGSRFIAAPVIVGCFVFFSPGLRADTNTAYGEGVLEGNTGTDNSAFGYFTMAFNDSGSENTAIGEETLASNGDGSYNTAAGV